MQLFYLLGLPSDNIGRHGFHDATKNQSQSYIPITGCILSHILSCSELSSLEKMYYILADVLSYINSSKGCNRSVSLPAKSWEERLTCSKSEVFILQKSLEDKGYFIIYRDKNDKGQNNRNTITTTIPDHVFSDLKYEPDRFNLSFDDNMETKVTYHSQSDNLDSIDKTFIPTLEGKRQHLAKTKMFIRVPYQFLKELNSNCSISATSKIVLLCLFTKIYKSSASKYDYDNSNSALTHKSYSIVTSYQELQTELKLHRNSLTKALKTLETANLIKRDQIVIKSDYDYNSRADKSLWRISLLNVPRTINHNNLHEQKGKTEYEKQIDKKQIVKSTTNTTIHTDDSENNTGVNKALKPLKNKGCTKYNPPCTDSGQLYIKDFLLNNSIIRNIDYIDVNHLNFENTSVNNLLTKLRKQSKTEKTEINHKEEFFEDKQSLSSSKSYNNSFTCFAGFQQQNSKVLKFTQPCSNKNPEVATGVIKDKSEQKEKLQELRHFYPLSEKDIRTLNSRANREFSNNFVNQLLLKLYIKYPEKRFKNRFTFLSYMSYVLANEKHQGPLVNHTNFRFSCNIGQEEKYLLEYEKYLSEIESSIDISKEMCVKKKIAGRFSTEVAYKILTGVDFKKNHDNSFITVLIPSNLTLSDRQIAILSQQLEAVYGIHGYLCAEEVEDIGHCEDSRGKEAKTEEVKEIEYPKIIVSHDTPIDTSASNSVVNTTKENTIWNQIRKGLIEELGEHIDRVWFSKAVAHEDSAKDTLTLTMPTKFMADWIKNNYYHIIRRLASSAGIKNVEYVKM